MYTPYRDQHRLPLYDTGAYDFNFATIWAENAFAGHDRIVDNNLVTGGLTTRLLDPERPGQGERRVTHLAKRLLLSPRRAIADAGRRLLDGAAALRHGAKRGS